MRISLIVLIATLLACSCGRKATTQQPIPTDTVEAAQLFESYITNEIAADKQYTNQRLYITGYVGRIARSNDSKEIYLTLTERTGNNPEDLVQCFLPLKMESDLRALQPRMRIAILGFNMGRKIATVFGQTTKLRMLIMDDCTIGVLPNNTDDAHTYEDTTVDYYVATEPENLKVDTAITDIERKQMLDALRTPVAVELKQDVKFVVKRINRCETWAAVIVIPMTPQGGEIDYKNTDWQEAIDQGAFDDGVQALLKYKNGVWLVAEYIIGATDSPFQTWLDKYDLEECSTQLL